MRHGLAALLALVIVGPAMGQAAGPPPDAAKIALARRAFDLNEGAEGVARFMDFGLQSSMRNLRVPNDPEVKAIVTKFVGSARAQVQSLSPQAVNAAVKVYATEYTTQELKDLIAFGESPSGRSIREKTPVVAKMTSAAILPIVNQALPSILRKSGASLCAQQHCTPKQLQVQTAILKGLPGSAH